MNNTHKKYGFLLSHLLDTVAHECIKGEFGNGKERVESLRKIGFSLAQAREIQRRVNTTIEHKKK